MFVLYWIDISLFWFQLYNWLTEKIRICFFISTSFTSELWNTTYLGPFWNSICYICGNIKKFATFLSKCCISWEIYKFATFTIHHLKLKLFNQLFQSKFIMANILVLLDCLFYCLFSLIFWRHCSVNIFSNFRGTL